MPSLHWNVFQNYFWETTYREAQYQWLVVYSSQQLCFLLDPMNCILGRMSLPRSRKTVIEKLIDVGLVSDKKQLYKKYEKKKKEKSSANNRK